MQSFAVLRPTHGMPPRHINTATDRTPLTVHHISQQLLEGTMVITLSLVHLQKEILVKVKAYLDLPKDAENREEFVLELRNSINAWVAKYRRSDFTGKQSFG